MATRVRGQDYRLDNESIVRARLLEVHLCRQTEMKRKVHGKGIEFRDSRVSLRPQCLVS